MVRHARQGLSRAIPLLAALSLACSQPAPLGQADFSPCTPSEDSCSQFASCAKSPVGITCRCYMGYAGDGFECVGVPGRLAAFELSAPDLMTAGACAEVSLQGIDFEGNDAAHLENPNVVLSGIGAEVFEDTRCLEHVDQVEGRAGKSVFLRAGDGLEAQVQASWKGGSQTWSIPITEHGLGDERAKGALVVYNANARHALEIATAYASARSIGAERLCRVHLPTGLYASATELLAARREIVESCFCPLVHEDERPADCGVETLSGLLPLVPVSHLVLVRGIPARLTKTGWASDFEEPSFDYYLSLTLAQPDTVEGGAIDPDGLPRYPLQHSSKGYAPPLDVTEHGFFAYGRVEAVTYERTLGLIERTMASEALGFVGRIVTESSMDTGETARPGFYFTSSFDPYCTSYLSHEPFEFMSPESSWPYEGCRWGSTGSTAPGSVSGGIPGEQNTTVPIAIGLQLFLGSDPLPNTQRPFDGFANLLNWRKSAAPCEALCKDIGDVAGREACRASSTDFFAEINTDCVGVAPGFMGHQVRSYPVQYYGFLPRSWWASSTGSTEKIPLSISSGGAFHDERFEDDVFAHFGDVEPGSIDENTCLIDGGEASPCPERIAVNLMRQEVLGEALPADEERRLLLRVRYRNQASKDGYFHVKLCLNDCQLTSDEELLRQGEEIPRVELGEAHPQWQLAEFELELPPAFDQEITSFFLWFDGRLHTHIRGFLDLDGIEVVDMGSGQQLLDLGAGSFVEADHEVVHAGEWASTVIDRMGGIAFWGSSSHHATGGWAYSDGHQTAAALFGGRTLGESLLAGSGKSGIIYGDPLYQGYAAKLSTSNGQYIAPGSAGLHLKSGEDVELRIDALQGRGNVDVTEWEVAVCAQQQPELCGSTWSTLLRGVGAVSRLPVDLRKLLTAADVSAGTLRLRTWARGTPEAHLSNYALFEVID